MGFLSDRWLSTTDCARAIGVSNWWIRDRIESGALPALVVHAGRRRVYRIRSSDWARFVATQTGSATDPPFGG
jgi:hypothetical protein